MSQSYPQSSIISYSFLGQIAKKIPIIPAGLMLLWGVPLWLATEAIAPQIVQAYTAKVDLIIDRLPEENYEKILQRAETMAREATQRSFDQDTLVTQVSVIVTAQNYGAIAPVIVLDVSRSEWENRPTPQSWATYFSTARSLLLFDKEPILPTTVKNSQPSTTVKPSAKVKNPKVLIVKPTTKLKNPKVVKRQNRLPQLKPQPRLIIPNR